MRPTFHLVPVAAWETADTDRPYAAASLVTEGFIHCTDGGEELVATANRHYLDDRRPFLVLTIDLDTAGSPWRTEDDRGIYPHVFGSIERAAIIEVVPAPRDPDGRFTALSEERLSRPGRG